MRGALRGIATLARMDEPGEQQVARRLMRMIASTCEIKIVTWRAVLGDREPGYEVEAWSEATGERWRVRAEDLYTAVVELAGQVGMEIEDV